MTRAQRNNNPGNVRISPSAWQGKKYPNTDGAFEQFETPEYGIRCLMITLRSYVNRHKKDTIRKIIDRWAPPNENNTTAYINTVAKRSCIGPDEKIAFEKVAISKITEAISFVESGSAWITMEQIDKAWRLL